MIPAQVAAEACFFGLTITVVLGCISGTLAHSIPVPSNANTRCDVLASLLACLHACMGDCLTGAPGTE